jgi:hypothetical protein
VSRLMGRRRLAAAADHFIVRQAVCRPSPGRRYFCWKTTCFAVVDLGRRLTETTLEDCDCDDHRCNVIFRLAQRHTGGSGWMPAANKTKQNKLSSSSRGRCAPARLIVVGRSGRVAPVADLAPRRPAKTRARPTPAAHFLCVTCSYTLTSRDRDKEI